MKRHTISLIALCWILGCATGAHAQLTSDRESLRGLAGVGVLLQGNREHLKQYGLSFEQIDTDVKLRLRKAGVAVFERNGGASNAPAYIVAYVSILKIDNDVCSFALSITVIQEAYLARLYATSRPTRAIYVTTWDKGSAIGSAGPADVRKTVRDALDDAVDEFLNDFLAVNPKN